MARERSILAGWTDYTGVTLDDIIEHFNECLKLTENTIRKLNHHLEEVEKQKSILENPQEVSSFLNRFIDLYGRYKNDFETLVSELPRGVYEAHLDIIEQLYRSSRAEEDITIYFKNDWVHKTLPQEEARPLLDSIYEDTRNLIVSLYDLANVVPRLRTFIRPGSSSDEFMPVVDLKPNFFGFGINLNKLFAKWFKTRKK